MSKDRQVIAHLSPAELVALMKETGIIAVQESGYSDGKPVIHAALKVVNDKTGEQLPGGLPFSVVMFKGLNEPGYTNIAVGTIVPASELRVSLPRDYFDNCNQRYRFTRVFPVDASSFVIQMDLVLRDATREYIKFSFGLWGALFTQILFELMGRSRESLVAVAEIYAVVQTDFAEQIASSPAAIETLEPEPLPPETIILADIETTTVVAEDEMPVPETVVEPVVEETQTEAPAVEDAKPDEPMAETSEADQDFGRSEHIEMVADPAEGKDDEPVEPEPAELTIVAGPSVAEPAVEIAAVAEPAPDVEEAASGEAEVKDVMPV